MSIGDRDLSMPGIANSSCYPGCYWEPMSAFVSGTYDDDYYRINPDDTAVNRRAMANFFLELYRNAPVVKVGKNPTHDVPFNIQAFIAEKAPSLEKAVQGLKWFMTVDQVDGLKSDELVKVWEYVFSVSSQHRLFCNAHGMIRPVQFAAFHHVTFDNLVQLTSGFKTYSGDSYELSELLRRELDTLEAKLQEVLANDEYDETKKLSYAYVHRSNFQSELKLNMSDSVHNILYPFNGEQFDLLGKYLDEGMPFDEYVEAMRPTMAGVYALAGMNALNLKFAPFVTAGQDYDNSQGTAYAKFVTSVSKAINKEVTKKYR
ncbi:hypothetical protein [Novimethylophilus kurashikiensis]|nr:hypothetical protein [Novimethylophilus kurashikiensis]